MPLFVRTEDELISVSIGIQKTNSSILNIFYNIFITQVVEHIRKRQKAHFCFTRVVFFIVLMIIDFYCIVQLVLYFTVIFKCKTLKHVIYI